MIADYLVIIFVVFSSVVLGLLVLISLLVGGSLLLIWLALLLVEGLPLVAEDFANLAKADARVLLTDVIALFVGEEHVGRETALGRVGVLLLLLTTTLGLGLGFGFRHSAGLGDSVGGRSSSGAWLRGGQ